MNNLFLIDLHIPLNYLIHEFINIFLAQLIFYSFIQIAVAQFSNNVSIIFSRVYFMECKHI